MCLQVYLSLLRADLQELRTCSNVCGLLLHRGLVGSLSFFHLKRLFLEESWSYVELIRKLNLRGAIYQMSFQVLDFCKVSSQFLYWPCVDCWTPFRNLLLSISLLTSWMTISLWFLPVDFVHHWFSFVPDPCLPGWVCPMISLKARLTFALMVYLTLLFTMWDLMILLLYPLSHPTSFGV